MHCHYNLKYDLQVLFIIIIVLNYKCIVLIIIVGHKISDYIFMNFIMLTLVFPDQKPSLPISCT